MENNILVKVYGCVKKPAKYYLPYNATVEMAVNRAGGFGSQKMKETGKISIRSTRKSDGRYYQRRNLNIAKKRNHLYVLLKNNDLVVVQFDVNSYNYNKSQVK